MRDQELFVKKPGYSVVIYNWRKPKRKKTNMNPSSGGRERRMRGIIQYYF